MFERGIQEESLTPKDSRSLNLLNSSLNAISPDWGLSIKYGINNGVN
jgi:hypothetical protein